MNTRREGPELRVCNCVSVCVWDVCAPFGSLAAAVGECVHGRPFKASHSEKGSVDSYCHNETERPDPLTLQDPLPERERGGRVTGVKTDEKDGE